MLIAIFVVGVVVVGSVTGLVALRGRSRRVSGEPSTPLSDPRTHARDTTDPATSIDQLRSQGNSGGLV
ncbi:hypothetical protein NE236_20280 [Actinoallomurus purpureus]|uniref:hypothetical protein n=1 Tax=Actinoallomurus purpureus TaxID=478114 RepID=UPI00209264FD|nr:hypothetical protein [Actinoallomurus purpureus]MCO6007322.1 hypothetical protein [Actinoallomurus purpureus]